MVGDQGGTNLLLQPPGAGNEGWELLADRLELIVEPATETVQYAATHGDNWESLEWHLVEFPGDIERHVGALDVSSIKVLWKQRIILRSTIVLPLFTDSYCPK
jgi:hypothetical protein